MKKLITISYLFVSFWASDSFASNQVLIGESLFKNENGYEIKLPKCHYAKTDDPAEENLDPKKLKFVLVSHNKNCRATSAEFSIDKVNLEGHKNALEFFTQFDKDTKMNNLYKSRSYLYSKEPDMNSFIQYLSVEDLQTILRWKLYKSCKDKVFVFNLGTPNNQPVPEALKNKIKKGDPSVPKAQMDVINTFRCIDK